MALPDAVRAKADQEIADFIAALRPIQVRLRTADPNARGEERYAQLLATHDVPPGGDEPPQTDRRLDHRTIGWAEVKAEGYSPPATLRVSLATSEYLTPSRTADGIARTPGWFVLARLRVGPPTETYFRVAHADGPEPGVDSGGWILEGIDGA